MGHHEDPWTALDIESVCDIKNLVFGRINGIF
jgi:hypothetical protein